MQFIAYGALHYVDGRESELFARFHRADGSDFDMPLSEEQLEFLLQQISPEEAAQQTSKEDHQQERPAPPPRRPHLAEVPEGATIRIAESDEDDEEGDL